MRFAFFPKQLVRVVILSAAAELVVWTSCARAMVGDVPAMPQTEQTTSVTGGGGSSGGSSGGTTGSTSTGSGSPATTPEPSALLSALLGLGLLGAYRARCRRLPLLTAAHLARALVTLHHVA
jgi:PEP-CTERM motif